MRLTHVIERAAQINPRGGGTSFSGRNHDWSTVIDRVARLAYGLRAKGLAAGDRVALISQNSDRFLEMLFAVCWAGGCAQPVNLRLAAAEVAEQIADSSARMVVLDKAGGELIAPVRSRLTGVQSWIAIESEVDAVVPYDTLIGDAKLSEPYSGGDNELAVLFYTGGTTGRPKGVMLSHRNLVASTLSQAAALPMQRDDISLHALPMFHVGAITGMLVGIVGGGKHCFLSRFEPVAFMQAVATERVTRSSLGPSMVKMVLDHPRFAEFDLSSLRRLHYGSAPITETLLEQMIRRLPSVGLVQGYGQTETSGVVSMLLQPYHTITGPNAGKLRSAGQIVPGLDVRIRTSRGEMSAAGQMNVGEAGEICVRADSVMMGYWNRPLETAGAFHDGWLQTGDVGYFDDEGFLYIVDRSKDMIVTGGENVFSAEVEQVLTRHPAVAECAVIGIPHATWGEQVHAIVVLRKEAVADEAALIAHCGKFIARFKCPKSIEIRTTPLPLSAVGKVLKAEIRKPYWPR